MQFLVPPETVAPTNLPGRGKEKTSYSCLIPCHDFAILNMPTGRIRHNNLFSNLHLQVPQNN